jgi:hypothetical protein
VDLAQLFPCLLVTRALVNNLAFVYKLRSPGATVMESKPITSEIQLKIHPPRQGENSRGKGREKDGRGKGTDRKIHAPDVSLQHAFVAFPAEPSQTSIWRSAFGIPPPWQRVCCSVTTAGPKSGAKPHYSEGPPSGFICFVKISTLVLVCI